MASNLKKKTHRIDAVIESHMKSRSPLFMVDWQWNFFYTKLKLYFIFSLNQLRNMEFNFTIMLYIMQKKDKIPKWIVLGIFCQRMSVENPTVIYQFFTFISRNIVKWLCSFNKIKFIDFNCNIYLPKSLQIQYFLL